MKGFVLAEQGHLVGVTPPIDITGGASGQAFSMKNFEHASILLMVGVSAAAFTKILVKQCTDAAGSNPVAIPFSLYAQEVAGASHDVLGVRQNVAAAGYTPAATDGIFYVIELDASELADGSPYVQVVFTNGTNSVLAACVAILSGGRFSGVGQSSAAV